MEIQKHNTVKVWKIVLLIGSVFFIVLPAIYSMFKMGMFEGDPVISIKANNTYKQTIRAVADYDFAPYSFYDENGNTTGYDVELLNEIANRLGKNVDIRLMDWSDAIKALETGEADILLGKEISTDSAKDKYAMTVTTAYDNNMIWSRNEIKSTAEIYGKKVGILSGDTFLRYTEKLFRCKPIQKRSYGEVLKGCEAGEYEYAICRKSVGSVIANKEDLDVYPYVAASSSFMCFATLTEKADLITEINKTIYDIVDDGTLKALQDKWMGHYIKHRPFIMVVRENPEVYLCLFSLIIGWFLIVAYICSKIGYDQRIIELTEKANKQLADTAQAAQKANQAKTEFLFNMAHDIRTPMNAILGYTNMGLRHIDNTDKIKENLKKIKTAGSHLLNLLNDILEMSRIESGNFEITENPMDICEITAGIDDMSQVLASAKDIDFKTTIKAVKNQYLYADELHVTEIIVNLISNAVKYTPEGGRIEYTITQIGEEEAGKVSICFEVSDNGIGMSEEFQKHLFEAFSREQTSSVSKQEGVGLGLSIVKRIVEMIGGTINVKSKLGEGSVFTVVLPFRVMEENAIAELKKEQENIKQLENDVELKGKIVLLTEDNEMNREIATEILNEFGLIVEAAEDGSVAVECVKEKGTNYYDIVLMDIQMPVMNGYEATKAIRALPGGDMIPIVALSANAFAEDVEKSLSIGMNAHIAKPIDVKEMLETIKRCLN